MAATPIRWPWASAKTPKLVPGTCWAGWTIVPIRLAGRDYIDQVLPAKPDEQSVLGVNTVEMPVVAMFGD